jgi:hypothetical protein
MGGELLQFALDTFLDGMAEPRPLQRQVAVRDATLITVLATRAPRRRALAGLRLGIHLSRGEDGWRVDRLGGFDADRRGNPLTFIGSTWSPGGAYSQPWAASVPRSA